MAPGPVLPCLTAWTEAHISAIYTASTTADFDAAFEAFLAENAQITMNGKPTSRTQYKALLQGERTNELNAKVTFNGGIEVPTHSDSVLTGSVGVFFTAAITTHLIKTSTVSSSLNINVLPVGVQTSPLVDPRKATVLNEVLIDLPETGIIPGVATA